MRRVTGFCAILGLLAAPLRGASSQQPPIAAEVVAKILNVGAAIDSAFRRGDAGGFAALFTEDAVLSPVDVNDVQGRDAIRAFIAAFFQTNVVSHYSSVSTALDVCDSAAYDRGTFTWAFVPRGQAPVTLRGRYTAMWLRRADRVWRVHRYLENLVLNVPPSR